jgi:hypothetical protein
MAACGSAAKFLDEIAVRWLLFALILILLIVAAWALLRVARRRRRAAARQKFLARRTEYERAFFAAASASGKPRGLRWKECRFDDGALFARDRATGEQIALVGVTISFEAIEGGDMEDVEAVGNLRCATAVFNHKGREWTTTGRAVFNLEPREVLDRFAESLEPATTDT